MKWDGLMASVVALHLLACGNQPLPRKPAAPPTGNANGTLPAHAVEPEEGAGADDITAAQARLPVMKLFIGKSGTKFVMAEIAVREHQRRCGMMFRKELPAGEGMLFVFLKPSKQGFYMKNTTVPLSIAYVGSSGRILDIHDLEPLNEKPVESSTDLVKYALEVPQGWFRNQNIQVGDVLRAEGGALDDVFFGKE